MGMMKNLLGKRELEVLRLVAEGYQSREIALIQGVSYWCVRRQIENVYIKLEAKNGPHAVYLAMKKGLL